MKRSIGIGRKRNVNNTHGVLNQTIQLIPESTQVHPKPATTIPSSTSDRSNTASNVNIPTYNPVFCRIIVPILSTHLDASLPIRKRRDPRQRIDPLN